VGCHGDGPPVGEWHACADARGFVDLNAPAWLSEHQQRGEVIGDSLGARLSCAAAGAEGVHESDLKQAAMLDHIQRQGVIDG